MASLNTFISIILLNAVLDANCARVVTIFSDFNNEDDLTFFRSIFPWVIGNIGTEIRVDYQFRDTGMASGPRKCILQLMDGNTYMQASYLKHEAEGRPRENFLHNFPIDSKRFSDCLFRNVNYYLKEAQRKFSRLQSTDTPVVLVSRDNEVSGLDADVLLDSLCQMFGRREPQGCIEPTPLHKEVLYEEQRSSNNLNNRPRRPPFRRPTTTVLRRLPKKTKEPNTRNEKYLRENHYYSL